MFHSLQRLAGLPDGVGSTPATSRALSARPGSAPPRSSTIAAERRNRALAYPRARRSSSRRTRRSPRRGRRPSTASSPSIAGLLSARSRRSSGWRATTHRCSTSAPRTSSRPVTSRGALNVPLSGSSLGTKAGFVLDIEQPLAIRASSPEEAEARPPPGCAPSACSTSPATSSTAPPRRRWSPSAWTSSSACSRRTRSSLVDVREKDERDEGYIRGSRHIPYRLVGDFAEELDNGAPGRDDLRERSARRGRGERAGRPRRAGAPGPGRGHPGPRAARPRPDELPPLRFRLGGRGEQRLGLSLPGRRAELGETG